MTLARLDRSEGAEAILEALKKEGGVIVERLFARPLIDRVNAELRETAASSRTGTHGTG